MSAAGRRVRIDLAYDGTDFAGWQAQAFGRTVQGEVEQALARLQGGRRAVLRGAGRTDAGVHARGQVADAWVETALDDAALEQALGRMLPRDVRPRAVRTVASGFHSRKDARSKTYHYALDRSRHGDPCHRRYALHVPWRLATRAMRAALVALPGRRDWSGFAAAGGGARDPVRELTEARFEEDDADTARFVFSGEGFLRHMVRNLVGTLLEIGRGRFAPDLVERILREGDRRLAGPTAAPRGLCLVRVDYPPEGAAPAAPGEACGPAGPG